MSMKPSLSCRSALPAALICTLAGACGAPEAAVSGAGSADPPVASQKQELYAKGSKIWRTLNVPVCWEQGLILPLIPGYPALMAAVRDQVTKTWSAATDVNFTGWGTCTPSSGGIRINVQDVNPNTSELGRYLDGETNGMTLDFEFVDWDPWCASHKDFCVRAIGVHEFGHALGFSHEQNRSDTPSSCTDAPQGEDGDTLVGSWDASSVMNYCAPTSLTLSSGDIAGSQLYYGGPQFKGTKRDVLDAMNGKIYFFNGSVYTRFDTDNMRVDSFYPKTTAAFWGGWPSSWSSGVDAAVNWGNGKAYFFRGSQYLRYDMNTDQVDPGYPTSITPNWHNWPASWTSVDAAVNWGNGKAYFFRGTEYVRVEIATHTVDAGYPRPMAGNWPGVPTNVEFVTTLDNGKAYFFKGSSYTRVEKSTFTAEYTNPIVGNWPGVPF